MRMQKMQMRNRECDKEKAEKYVQSDDKPRVPQTFINIWYGINFINILRTNFSYERRCFYIHVIRENNIRTKKFVRITLMKVTNGCTTIPLTFCNTC
jgi:hypothetical protein